MYSFEGRGDPLQKLLGKRKSEQRNNSHDAAIHLDNILLQKVLQLFLIFKSILKIIRRKEKESYVFNNKGERKVFYNIIGYSERGQKDCKQITRATEGESKKTDVNGYKRNESSRKFCYITVCSGTRKG